MIRWDSVSHLFLTHWPTVCANTAQHSIHTHNRVHGDEMHDVRVACVPIIRDHDNRFVCIHFFPVTHLHPLFLSLCVCVCYRTGPITHARPRLSLSHDEQSVIEPNNFRVGGVDSKSHIRASGTKVNNQLIGPIRRPAIVHPMLWYRWCFIRFASGVFRFGI